MSSSSGSKRLLVIIGITGNQGGSVAKTFLSDPLLRQIYRIRGISRNISSQASLDLKPQGVEMIQANLHDPQSLLPAFANANIIFSITDFWAPFLNPEPLQKAESQGKRLGQLAYEFEYEQGRNIADAAAQIPSLERFVVSMLSSPRKWSKGQYQHLWQYESKADMITYIKTQHPSLAAKMSESNMGVFFQSWRFVNLIAPRQIGDEYVLTLPCKGETPCPLVNPRNDTGPFVRVLLQLELGVQLYGETSLISWREWMGLWGRVLGKEVRYEQVSIEYYENELRAQGSPVGFGTEIAEMFEYMDTYGYNGNDPACKRKEELGITILDLSNVEAYIRSEDWSSVGA